MTRSPSPRRMLVRVMGVVVDVPVPDAAVHRRLQKQWQRALVDPATVVDTEISSLAGSGLEGDRLDYRITTSVTLAALEATAGKRMNFHAAGLADPDGRLLALVAQSGTGKTTATAKLGRVLGYVSDETVSLDADYRVAPHPKPLSMVLPGDDPRHKSQHSPDELGLLPTPPDCRLARIVVLDRSDAHATPGLTRLPLTYGLVELLPQTSGLARCPDPLRWLARIVEHCGGVHVLRYREIDDHLADLVSLLRTPVRGPQPAVTHHPPYPLLDPVPPGQIVRTPYADAVECEDEVVVFRASNGYRLDNLGATLWRACGTPRTREELVQAAELAHGHHPAAARLVKEAVEALTEGGLLMVADG